jgi:hypothetical protein
LFLSFSLLVSFLELNFLSLGILKLSFQLPNLRIKELTVVILFS